jgi:hypothetical protein
MAHTLAHPGHKPGGCIGKRSDNQWIGASVRDWPVPRSSGGPVAIRSTQIQGRSRAKKSGDTVLESEHSIQNSVLAWLRASGVFHFRLNNFPMPLIRRQGFQRVLVAFKPVDNPGAA